MGVAGVGAGTCFGGAKMNWTNYWLTRTPSAVTLTVISDTEIKVDFTINGAGQDGHKIYISTDGINYTLKGTVTGSTATYSAMELTAGTLYYFYVKAYKGSQESPASSTASATTWVTDYNTLYTALTGTKPSATIANAQNDFIDYTQGNNPWSRNTWAKFACIMPYFAGMPTASDSLFWWNDPTRKGTLSATTPTYTVKKGWKGGTTAKYIDTTFNPVADGGSLFTQNDACHVKWIWENRITGTNQGMGHYDGSKSNYYTQTATDIYYSVNSPAVHSANAPGGAGLWEFMRTGSVNVSAYKHGKLLETKASTSGALINTTVYDLALRRDASVIEASADTLGLEIFASSLDSTDFLVLNNAVANLIHGINTYPASGAGVCIQFDDTARTTDNLSHLWSLYAKYNFKATHFLQGEDALLDTHAETINQLISMGHEIGNHSVNHIDWETYLLTNTPEDFYQDQVKPIQDSIIAKFGVTPATYGYAQVNGHDTDLDANLVGHGFKVRWGIDGLPGSYDEFAHTTGSDIIPSALIYNYYPDHADVIAILEWAKTNNKIVSLTFHSITAADSNLEASLDLLTDICDYVEANNMKFYTCNELP